MLKSLRHPRVVLFMGACLNPGNLAIVTEYLPRNSLYQVTNLLRNPMCGGASHPFDSQVLREENAQQLLSWSVKKQMLLDVASGMLYLHSNSPPVSPCIWQLNLDKLSAQVLHLDLKSLNLLVDDNLRLKVSGRNIMSSSNDICQRLFLFRSECILQVGDFGLATLKKTKQSSVDAMGTVHWMAPELLSDNRADEKADVYGICPEFQSHCVMLFHMLFGADILLVFACGR
jgi:serine/threonine-protein kinase CTR1